MALGTWRVDPEENKRLQNLNSDDPNVVDAQKERISLGVKQLIDDPVKGSLAKIKKGDIVTCTVTKVVERPAFVCIPVVTNVRGGVIPGRR